MVVCEYLSLNCFLAAFLYDKYMTLTTFSFAGSSCLSPNHARTLGVWSVTSRVNSVVEFENFAIITFIWNRSSHLFQSITRVELASCQYTCNPTRCDKAVVDNHEEEELLFSARSSMLTYDGCFLNGHEWLFFGPNKFLDTSYNLKIRALNFPKVSLLVP